MATVKKSVTLKVASRKKPAPKKVPAKKVAAKKAPAKKASAKTAHVVASADPKKKAQTPFRGFGSLVKKG